MADRLEKSIPVTEGWRQHAFALAVVAASLLCFWAMQAAAVGERHVPETGVKGAGIAVVATQRDAYRICAANGIRGATVVQLGRFSNLQYWAPEYLGKPTPFPIKPFDVRPEYEKALQSHNWLFIANTNGIVRKVVSILTPGEFQRMVPAFDADYELVRRAGGYGGFHFDVPRTVTTLDALRRLTEPVVVVVDASYFEGVSEPAETAYKLAERVPAAALVIAVSSMDENEVTWEMRRQMAQFLRAWQETT
ncbi:MAG TPA: hypothetical protein VI298_09570 [Geobacteraceae bacterium]